jgi:lipopolysaccharide transport system ATP-binding protein
MSAAFESSPEEAAPRGRLRLFQTARPSTVQVRVVNATLDYPLGPLTRASLKSHLFGLLGQKDRKRITTEYVRALDGISFSVGYGDRLGVIGKNGSGKSTLLRALAGVFPLSGGEIHITGTVQGMFDIGLGFEPEATGRENILYRGLVMGMSPQQIRDREAEIVEFADIGGFIDLPVRTYSSGMSVRLAFAISTYLQGDILLLDEMLGAGDAAFQAKAAARMQSIVQSAGALVLVSHDMGVIRSVCNRVIWLDSGKIIAEGDPGEMVDRYLETTAG